MSIVITDVVTEYGAYYVDQGQNMSNLTKKLFRPGKTAELFGVRPTDQTTYRMTDAQMSRALQPFQKAFTPVGSLTFKPWATDLFNLKIDKAEYPDEIVDSYLGFLEGPGIVREEWPFVRWMLEEHVIPTAIEDFELYEAFAGVFAAPTPGTAGDLGTGMDGIAAQFTRMGSRKNTISMGAMPSSDEDIVEYIDEFFAGIDKEYRKIIDVVCVNEDVHLAYRRGKRSKYNMNYNQEADLDRVIDFPNASVVGLPSMGSSDLIWATPAANRVRPLKKNPSAKPVVKEFSARQVSVYSDWWTVLAFLRPEAVFVNDQEA
jgi:hypothetical protein